MQNVIVNPYHQFVRPIVTTVPMINIRLDLSDETYDLEQKGLKQSQLFLENGFVSTRETSVIYSKEVLFFFIDRRVSIIRYSDMLPYSLDRLPTSVAGFENIHLSPVSVPLQIKVNNEHDKYEFVSGIVADCVKIKDANHVTGSSTILRYQPESDPIHKWYVYSPSDSKRGKSVDYRAMTEIEDPQMAIKGLTENSIVLMYKLVENKTEGNILYSG